MTLKNSYIFLEHPNKQPSSYKDEQGNLVFVVGNNIYSFVTNEFPFAVKDTGVKDIFKTKLDYNLNEGKMSCSVSFVITEVEKITYLDVIASGNGHYNLIACLEYIQDKLLNSGIRRHYIEIVSYDAISEYYCNKAFVKLNSLERNLRKLLFNIYILHFGKDYYSATMDTVLQEKIKGLIGSSNAKEYQREVKQLYNVSTEHAKAIIRLQQFFYSLDFADLQQFLFSPTWTSVDEEERSAFLTDNKDLSILSNEELRKAFEKYSPKSDWERFFSCKIQISDIEELIDEIRRYRNAVAHLKFFYKDDYNRSNKLILKLNKAIVEAIKLTEEKDFAEKNAESLRRVFAGITETITEMLQSIREATLKFIQSETFQMLKNISTQIRESGIIKNLGKAALQAAEYLSLAEDDDSIEANEADNSAEEEQK